MKSNSPLTLFAIGITLAATTAVGQTSACQQTSQDALRACRTGAQSSLLLALGTCDNVSNHVAQKTCRQQAQADFKTASQLCDDGFAVRQTGCQRLGPQPYDPVIDPANFVSKIDNPYFPLTPGTTLVYEGLTSTGLVHVDFAVTDNTKQILGVTTVEVHDTVLTNGAVTEDTLDWYAQDKDGNVWYFGESTEELIGGRPTTLGGTFTAGVKRAKPGIIMPAHPAIGNFSRQEFDLGNAEDFADVQSLTDTVVVPGGTFKHCLRTHETTPLEPALSEDKLYAPGIGNVLTRDLTNGDEIPLIQIKVE